MSQNYLKGRKQVSKQIYDHVCAASRGKIQELHDFLLNIKLISTVMMRKGVGMNKAVAKFIDDSVTEI